VQIFWFNKLAPYGIKGLRTVLKDVGADISLGF